MTIQTVMTISCPKSKQKPILNLNLRKSQFWLIQVAQKKK